MDPLLSIWQARQSLSVSEDTRWKSLSFLLRTYATVEPPPLHLVTSVRAIMLGQGTVMVVRDPHGRHILPGGRREPGEALLATLARELREETGWQASDPRLIGVRHFHHRDPMPAGYPYPYPDFLQLVYAARLDAIDPAGREPDGFELEATLMPVEDARALPLSPGERLLLDAARS
ncbi:MAG TPA: NUDIX hydrolase [Ktedonobacterales bacterium]